MDEPKILRPVLPLSKTIKFEMVWQVLVPGEQMVTLIQG